MPLSNASHEQAAHIGAMVIEVFKSGHAASAEENALLRAELKNVKAAWNDLWEKAGCPAGTPE
jgi:hypothetical protein